MATAPRRAPRAEPIDRLRDDVRLLGELVGDILREQGGQQLFEAVEHVRRAAIDLRSDPSTGKESELREWLERLRNANVLALARAFGVYFSSLAVLHHNAQQR